MKKDIKSFNIEELEQEMIHLGDKAFRAKQIYQWIHAKLVEDFEEMSNISKNLRTRLSEEYELNTLNIVDIKTSKIDGTQKYLFQLQEETVMESVLMKYHHGNSVCISSQAGCRMGCRFCASTLDGLERNLRPSELLEQIYKIQRQTGDRISNIVVMGSGEPLDNYENLVQFIQMISDKSGLNISQRNITVSTCGLVPEIIRLADEQLQITLALSLHAPNDEIRRQIMPVAKRYTMNETLDALNYYFEKTGRRITFEYSLIAGINDKLEHAQELGTRLKGLNCHVNLIPINPIKERDFEQTQKKQIADFKNMLEKYTINVTIRREMGRDIDGACGQLRKRYLDKQKEKRRERNEGMCYD